MNWEEDVDLLPTRKSSASNTKFGRRATPGSPEDPHDNSAFAKGPPEVPMRARKSGGWASEGSKSAKGKSTTNIIEQERFHKLKSQDSIEDDIPVIPDIDDLPDDPLNLSDVKVPNVTVKESTYKELDNEILESGQPNLGNLGDVDLSIFTSRLYPERDVKKCTDGWTMEYLYHELSKQ